MIPLPIRRLPHAEGLQAPSPASDGAAGLDLRAAIPGHMEITLKKSERVLVPTGFALQLPEGYEAQVRPRSGLALKHGVTVLNAPGTIDHDYRGEVMVLLINHGEEPFVIRRGERIAQMVVAPVTGVRIVEVAELDDTQRGLAGFGSTGLG
jgi:dUTP pyrophosphatase